jgi:hypothetical protein
MGEESTSRGGSWARGGSWERGSFRHGRGRGARFDTEDPEERGGQGENGRQIEAIAAEEMMEWEAFFSLVRSGGRFGRRAPFFSVFSLHPLSVISVSDLAVLSPPPGALPTLSAREEGTRPEAEATVLAMPTPELSRT